MRDPAPCPVCGCDDFRVVRSQAAVGREAERRRSFVLNRFTYKPSEAELMDLTRFMHGGPGELLECLCCRVGARQEDDPADYGNDRYDPELLDVLYPRYRAAFLAREPHYRGMLDPGAEVMEVGSHLGAFLEAAEEWGWRPAGLDIGIDTSAFTRRRGLPVERSTLEDAKRQPRSADGIFVWNCFEQLDEPQQFLRQAHTLLKRHGIVAVRVPNFGYYAGQRVPVRRREFLSLAYNNLLGFPYKTGYTPASLVRLLRENGFEPLWGRNSGLLAYPLPEWKPDGRREFRSVRTDEAASGPVEIARLAGPWIEVVSRKAA